MEGKRHLLRRLDPHIVRQALVECKADLIPRNPALGIETATFPIAWTPESVRLAPMT